MILNLNIFSYETLTSSATDIEKVSYWNLRSKILQTEFATISNTVNYDTEFLTDIITRATYYQKYTDYSTGEISYSFFDYRE